MGVRAGHFCGPDSAPVNWKVQRISRHTEKRIEHHRHEHTADCIRLLKEQGFTCIALEVTSRSVALPDYPFNHHHKIALFTGSEQHGIEAATLAQMDACVQIPMFGLNTSINVVQALSIGLYEIVRQVRSTKA